MNELKTFMYEANQLGYLTGNYKDWIKEKDGSTTICYAKENWKMLDNFFGGEPFGGRLTIFYKNKPVWIMVYYGFIKEFILPIEEVYRFLRSALLNIPKEFPIRGPKKYVEKNLTYKNTWQGKINQYFGKEKIFIENKEIYQAFYFGGLINLRSG